jgi:DNA polymerase
MSIQQPSKTDPIAKALVQRLESLQRAGITHLMIKRRLPSSVPVALTLRSAVQQAAESPMVPLQPKTAQKICASCEAATIQDQQALQSQGYGQNQGQEEDRVVALAALAKKVTQCTRCKELAETRTQTVFGVGNPFPRLVFCGEAPGADEDRQGEPFVGRAGQLLNDIIVKGMKMRREDVYILNILRCRPPQNRNPLPVEAAACREFLDKQLAILQPEFICCLGAVAAQNLLSTDTPIGRLRRQVLDYQGIKVVCTYHPAYVLRNPSAKKPVWEDIQMLMAEMGLS